MTYYGNNDIEVTATVHNNSKEYFSDKTVTGIALYIEQNSDELEDFMTMTLLLSPEGEVTLLKNNHFPQETVERFIHKAVILKDEIRDYIREVERN